MKILIVGDSFAADWTVKYNDYKGWPNLLEEKYTVVNLAQAGVGQYKIYKQLQSADLKNFDLVISSYTSPYRVHTQKHPIHSEDPLHRNCDLLANDIEFLFKKYKNNHSLITARNYFKYHFDFDYYDDLYQIIVDKCDQIIGDKKHIQISNLPYVGYDWSSITENYKGLINHLSKKGNLIIFDRLVELIKQVGNLG